MSAVKSTNATGSDMKQAAWDNDRMDEVTSPMAPFKDGLWSLKLIGLPLKCNENATEFVGKGRLLKCIFITQGITSVISISWLGNLFGHGIFFETLANLVPRKWILISYIEAAKDYGFKKWDVYAMFIFWLPSVLIPVVFYFLYNRLGNKMSEFVRQYVELGSLITGCDFEVYKKTRHRVIFAYLLLSLAALIWGIANTFFFLNKELTLAGSIINGICGAGLILWMVLPPPAFASLELIIYLMGLLCAVLRRYKSHLEEMSINHGKQLKDFRVQTGFKVLKLIRHTESTLGPMIVTLYVFLFGICCAGMFYCTGIGNVSLNGIFYPTFLLFCLNVMMQGLCSAILLSYMIRMGQDMSDYFSSIGGILEGNLVDDYENMDAHDRARTQILVDKFSGQRAPFRPMDLFDVNYSTTASIVGLITTYYIVLLQFKLSE